MVEAPAPRRSIGAQRSPDSERAILDAAEALLAETGLNGFSIEAVARRARAGKPTIYRWWPSRTALLLAVYQRQKTVLPDPDTGSLAGDIETFLINLLAFWRDTAAGNVYRSIIAEAQSNPDAAAAFGVYTRERREHTARIFARARGQDTPDAGTRLLAELAAAYAIDCLLTGALDMPRETLAAVAAALAAGVAR